MDIGTERVGSAVILHLDGHMSAECDAGWTRTALASGTVDGVRHVLVDFGRVRRLDCCGIGQLLALRGQLHEARRTLCLVDIERHQRRMLELAGLHHVFRVFRDCDAAASALGVGRGAPKGWALDSHVPARDFGPGCREPYWAAAPVY